MGPVHLVACQISVSINFSLKKLTVLCFSFDFFGDWF